MRHYKKKRSQGAVIEIAITHYSQKAKGLLRAFTMALLYSVVPVNKGSVTVSHEQHSN